MAYKGYNDQDYEDEMFSNNDYLIEVRASNIKNLKRLWFLIGAVSCFLLLLGYGLLVG